MAISPASTHEDWAAVLGRVQQLEAERPAAYGVAVDSALQDLQAAVAAGRPLAPYLREATRVGCPPQEIFRALEELRGTGVAAPPL